MTEQRKRKRAVRSAFDRAASTYDAAAAVQREACARLRTFADAHLLAHEASRVVDAGCGTGHALAALMGRFPQAQHIALDFSPTMLLRACQNGAKALPLCADIEHLPLRNASIDVIWSSLAVQWCSSGHVAAEIARVLTPGGMAWIATLGPRTLHELSDAFAQIDDVAHVIRFQDATHWRSAAEQAGLETLAVEQSDIAGLAADLRSLLRDIKAIGAHTLDDRRRQPLGKSAWWTLQCAYEKWRRADGQLPATYDLILIALRKPA